MILPRKMNGSFHRTLWIFIDEPNILEGPERFFPDLIHHLILHRRVVEVYAIIKFGMLDIRGVVLKDNLTGV